MLVLQPFFFQCLEGVALHPSYRNTVTLTVGVLSGIGQKAPGARLSLTFACCLVAVTCACTP